MGVGEKPDGAGELEDPQAARAIDREAMGRAVDRLIRALEMLRSRDSLTPQMLTGLLQELDEFLRRARTLSPATRKTSIGDETLATVEVPPDLATSPEFLGLLKALGNLYRAHGGAGLQIAEPEGRQAIVAANTGAP